MGKRKLNALRVHENYTVNIIECDMRKSRTENFRNRV